MELLIRAPYVISQLSKPFPPSPSSPPFPSFPPLVVGFIQLAIVSIFLYLWIAIRLDNRTVSRIMWYVMAIAFAVLASFCALNQGENSNAISHAISAFLFILPVLNIVLFETYLCDQDKAPRKLKTLRTIAIIINSIGILLILWNIIQYGFGS